jgi:hypothetical protein
LLIALLPVLQLALLPVVLLVEFSYSLSIALVELRQLFRPLLRFVQTPQAKEKSRLEHHCEEIKSVDTFLLPRMGFRPES